MIKLHNITELFKSARYCAGTFEHVSVEDLQSRNPPEGDEKTIMKVVAGDVVNLINDRANNGAVFQVC